MIQKACRIVRKHRKSPRSYKNSNCIIIGTKELDPPRLSFITGLTLEEVEKQSGKNDTLISTKTGLLGAGCGEKLLDSDPYDLDLLARDLEGYRESITALTKCLDTTSIFDGNGLEFTLPLRIFKA